MSHQNDEVTLIANGKEIKASKECLSQASDYFKAMFGGGFAESSSDTVNLQGVDDKSLQALIQSLNGSFSYTLDELIPLYETSSMLQFTAINKTIEDLMRGSISVDNCLQIYNTASSHGAKDLAIAARTISAWKFHEVITKDSFLQLGLKGVINYLKEPGLNLGNDGEWKIWEAIVKWVEHEEVIRKTHIFSLIQILDFNSFSKDDLLNLLWFPLVSDDEDSTSLIQSIMKLRYRSSHLETDAGNASNHILAEELLSRPKRTLPQTTCVLGFVKEKQRLIKDKLSDDEEESVSTNFIRYIPVVYEYDDTTNQVKSIVTCHKLMERDTVCSGFKVCCVGPYIYIFGGEYQYGYSKWNQVTWCYSTITQTWIIQDSMPDVRRHFMCCELKNVIYLIGGIGKHRITQSSVTAFDTTTGNWSRIADLPVALFSGAACSYKEQVLVFSFGTVHSLNPNYKSWVTYKIHCSDEISFKDAMTWKDYIFLTGHATQKIYYINFLEEKTVYLFGEFQHPVNNVCIKDGKIYSFTANEDKSIIEIMDISGANTSAKASTHITWAKNDAKEIEFLLQNSLNTTFYSYGCFPLIRC